jgi:sugar lactone lactonase YvrE
MAGSPISVTQDAAGNTYFVEDGASALSGAYKIPAGQTGLKTDSGLARIDPSLPQVTGVAADVQGNIYIGDNTLGVFVYPHGATSSSAAFLLTTVTAQGEVAFFGNTGLVIPTTQTQSNGYGDVAEVSFNAAQFGAVGVGAAPASEQVTFTFNASTTPAKIEVLEAGKSTPDFTVDAGAKSTCLSTQLLPPYAAQTSCPVTLNFAPLAAGNVSATLVMLGANNTLLASIPLDGSGTGAAVQALPAAQSTIGAKGSLKSPSQMAVDAAGNLYVADSGLGAVEMYPANSASGTAGTPVGTGLKAPTGVAVDGAGDVFIADSGSVYEVPESDTGAGLNAKGQITLKTALGSQVQLAADGLGDLYISDASNKKVYELGNFSTGLNTSLPGVLALQSVTLSGAAVSAPSAIAVDPYNDLFVVDGGSVYEITPAGTQTQVLSGLSGINGVAVDPSGSVLVSATGGTVRIPYVSGALNPASETPVATGVGVTNPVTNPTAVTLDSLGNIYVADGSALDVNFTSASAGLNFKTLTADPPAANSSETLTATLLNFGNAPLKVTGYNSVLNYFQPTNAAAAAATGVPTYIVADFTETSDTCSGATVAIDSTCTATITFSPAPGDGGNLTEQVLVQGNVSNAPVGVDATGVAPTLAIVTATAPTSTTGTIENVPVAVTVTPKVSGSPTPTGTVTLTVVYGNNVPLTQPALPTKYQLTVPLKNGVATFNSAIAKAQGMPMYGLPIANYTFTARYNGDTAYTYANSSASAPVSVATAVPTVVIEPTINASPLNTAPTSPAQLEPYTLPCTSGPPGNCTTSYNWGQPASNPPGYLVVAANGCIGCVGSWGSDGTVPLWAYNYPLTVASASGDLIVGTAAYAGQTLPSGYNLGSVNYVGTNGSLCGSVANSASIIDVYQTNGVDTAPFPVDCAPIIGINGAVVPVFMAYFTFTPQYSGEYSDLLPSDTNPNYTSSTAAPVNIWGVAHPVVQISSSPAALIVAPGSSVSATLTLASVLGYGYMDRDNGPTQIPNYAMPLALQCQGLPAYASCSFTYPTPNPSDRQATAYPVGALASPYNTVAFPAFGGLLCQNSTAAAPAYCAIDIGPPPGFVPGLAVNHNGKAAPSCDASDGCLGPGQVVMTITTNVPLGTVSSRKTYQGGIAFASIFGLGLLGLTFRRKVTRFRKLSTIACALLWGGTLIGITACSTTTLGTEKTGITPTGTYWVTVTANQAGTMVIPGLTYNQGIPNLIPGNGDQMSLPYTINVTITN